MNSIFRNMWPDTARTEFDNGVEFIDIREEHEFAESRIPGSRWLPMSEISRRMNELPRDRDAVIYCRTGSRSADLLKYLTTRGYTNLINLAGGIVAWYEEGYPVDSDRIE
ncbi:MAG: rhodanese-like domain-containing protein [Calditrichaceae bacterium]